MKKLPLILILLIGVLTPVFSTLLFYAAPPPGNTARGEILPPRPAPADWNLNQGKWTLLFAGRECGEQCKKRLCQMRQLRLMLPGAYLRLQRAWLRPPGAPEPAEFAGLTASADCGEARAAAFAAEAKQVNIAEGVVLIRGGLEHLPPPGENLSREDYLYLIDPSGIFAIRFAPELDIYAVQKDAKRLLKISKGVKRTSAEEK